MKKTLKELKNKDIVWFVSGITIKEAIIHDLRIGDFRVYGLGFNNYKYKPHYVFDIYIDGKKKYNYSMEVEESKDDTDTAIRYDDGKDYDFDCCFLNKEDAVKQLKKNIKAVLKEKRKKFKEIKNEISLLKHQLEIL